MPGPEITALEQWMVLWAATGNYDDHNQAIVATTPVEIRARVTLKRMEVTDPLRGVIVLDGRAVVAVAVKVGSVLWLGKLAEYASLPSSSIDVEHFRVTYYNATPDIKGRLYERTLGLQRFKSVPFPTEATPR